MSLVSRLRKQQHMRKPGGPYHELFKEAADELERLDKLINTPIVDDWLAGVRLEAAHQVERWGTEGHTRETPSGWFALVAYLGAKVVAALLAGDVDKAKHHTISTGAALLNWWRHISKEQGEGT